MEESVLTPEQIALIESLGTQAELAADPRDAAREIGRGRAPATPGQPLGAMGGAGVPQGLEQMLAQMMQQAGGEEELPTLFPGMTAGKKEESDEGQDSSPPGFDNMLKFIGQNIQKGEGSPEGGVDDVGSKNKELGKYAGLLRNAGINLDEVMHKITDVPTSHTERDDLADELSESDYSASENGDVMGGFELDDWRTACIQQYRKCSALDHILFGTVQLSSKRFLKGLADCETHRFFGLIISSRPITDLHSQLPLASTLDNPAEVQGFPFPLNLDTLYVFSPKFDNSKPLFSVGLRSLQLSPIVTEHTSSFSAKFSASYIPKPASATSPNRPSNCEASRLLRESKPLHHQKSRIYDLFVPENFQGREVSAFTGEPVTLRPPLFLKKGQSDERKEEPERLDWSKHLKPAITAGAVQQCTLFVPCGGEAETWRSALVASCRSQSARRQLRHRTPMDEILAFDLQNKMATRSAYDKILSVFTGHYFYKLQNFLLGEKVAPEMAICASNMLARRYYWSSEELWARVLNRMHNADYDFKRSEFLDIGQFLPVLEAVLDSKTPLLEAAKISSERFTRRLVMKLQNGGKSDLITAINHEYFIHKALSMRTFSVFPELASTELADMPMVSNNFSEDVHHSSSFMESIHQNYVFRPPIDDLATPKSFICDALPGDECTRWRSDITNFVYRASIIPALKTLDKLWNVIQSKLLIHYGGSAEGPKQMVKMIGLTHTFLFVVNETLKNRFGIYSLAIDGTLEYLSDNQTRLAIVSQTDVGLQKLVDLCSNSLALQKNKQISEDVSYEEKFKKIQELLNENLIFGIETLIPNPETPQRLENVSLPNEKAESFIQKAKDKMHSVFTTLLPNDQSSVYDIDLIENANYMRDRKSQVMQYFNALFRTVVMAMKVSTGQPHHVHQEDKKTSDRFFGEYTAFAIKTLRYLDSRLTEIISLLSYGPAVKYTHISELCKGKDASNITNNIKSSPTYMDSEVARLESTKVSIRNLIETSLKVLATRTAHHVHSKIHIANFSKLDLIEATKDHEFIADMQRAQKLLGVNDYARFLNLVMYQILGGALTSFLVTVVDFQDCPVHEPNEVDITLQELEASTEKIQKFIDFWPQGVVKTETKICPEHKQQATALVRDLQWIITQSETFLAKIPGKCLGETVEVRKEFAERFGPFGEVVGNLIFLTVSLHKLRKESGERKPTAPPKHDITIKQDDDLRVSFSRRLSFIVKFLRSQSSLPEGERCSCGETIVKCIHFVEENGSKTVELENDPENLIAAAERWVSHDQRVYLGNNIDDECNVLFRTPSLTQGESKMSKLQADIQEFSSPVVRSGVFPLGITSVSPDSRTMLKKSLWFYSKGAKTLEKVRKIIAEPQEADSPSDKDFDSRVMTPLDSSPLETSPSNVSSSHPTSISPSVASSIASAEADEEELLAEMSEIVEKLFDQNRPGWVELAVGIPHEDQRLKYTLEFFHGLDDSIRAYRLSFDPIDPFFISEVKEMPESLNGLIITISSRSWPLWKELSVSKVDFDVLSRDYKLLYQNKERRDSWLAKCQSIIQHYKDDIEQNSSESETVLREGQRVVSHMGGPLLFHCMPLWWAPVLERLDES
eukprot:GHVP01002775.1.p1 GENE.GHVP01002775.1~~GHVP01002775.1.p1  ORF type:complete len:1767 (+),score=330.48 GHVP01002775.1:502-5301(+)